MPDFDFACMLIGIVLATFALLWFVTAPTFRLRRAIEAENARRRAFNDAVHARGGSPQEYLDELTYYA